MKKIFLLFQVALILSGSLFAQTIDISEARTKNPGTEVTVSGIVTCDVVANEGVRYIQDPSGGIAVFSYDFGGAVSRGDSVTVTGSLKDYNNLLELDPVASWEIHSSDNPLPTPVQLIPSQLAEQYEGMLVQFENVVFAEGGEEFASGEYTPTSNDQEFQMYVHSNSPLISEVVPNQPVTLIGIVSQFYEDYQLVVRDIDDLIVGAGIYMKSGLTISNLSQTGFDLIWTTNVEGSTELWYGNTPEYELGKKTGTGNSVVHIINFTGEDPGELFYVKAFSVLGEDTAFSAEKVFVTHSASSGDIKVYFNNTVDNTVSTGADAIQLFEAIDDTLINYINRAKYSIDFTIYNYNTTGISDITAALNAAHGRGVEIRVVYDMNMSDNAGWDDLNAAIGKIVSPEDDYENNIGIMHNKFVVFDANSPDPNDPIVWTGSTNFTPGQINEDPNNVIIIQDQSLAKVYRVEFEEMFGSSGLQPDPANARFGPKKLDNTPNEFLIDTIRVECYFSPSGKVNTIIEDAVRSADHQAFANTMLNTRTSIAYAFKDVSEAGVDTRVLVNSEGQCDVSNVIEILQNLGANFRDYNGSGILHHKTLIVDPGYPEDDPLVLTGCHNWSSSADNRNDENTLIIHSQEIANIYYQEFVERWKQGEVIAELPVTSNDFSTMDQGDTLEFDLLDNDDLPGAVTVTIQSGPFHGSATLDASGVVTYIPEPEFAWLDTIKYKVCLVSSPGFCDSATFVINVKEVVGINSQQAGNQVDIYHDPVINQVNIVNKTERILNSQISIFSITGQLIETENRILSPGYSRIRLSDRYNGIFILEIRHEEGVFRKKLWFY